MKTRNPTALRCFICIGVVWLVRTDRYRRRFAPARIVSMALGTTFGGGIGSFDISNERNVRLHIPPHLDIIRLKLFLVCDPFEFFAHLCLNGFGSTLET